MSPGGEEREVSRAAIRDWNAVRRGMSVEAELEVVVVLYCRGEGRKWDRGEEEKCRDEGN